jgi:transcriptional regulator GlxA family with amidase domain
MLNIQKLAAIFLIVAIAGCTSSSPETKEDNTSSRPDSPGEEWNVGFVIVEGVYNSELVAPMDIFHHTVFHTDPAMKVFTVAPSTQLVTSFEGLKIQPDYSFDSPDLPEIDVLVVPSAEHSMDSDLQNEALISFIREKGSSANYVLSLCDGAFVLARAGLVDGKVSTTFPSDIQRYKEMYPDLEVLENLSFVHDGNLITSAGGAKSYDPALYLCELLYGREVARGLGRGLVIDWDLSTIKYHSEPR